LVARMSSPAWVVAAIASREINDLIDLVDFIGDDIVTSRVF